jgi:hypothetical protein
MQRPYTRFFNVMLLIAAAGVSSPRPTYRLAAPSTAPRRHAPIRIRERRGGTVTSDNWSGYAVTGAKGSVNDVKGSWVVPAIQGTCPSTNQYSSFWVGIDGYDSNTVEQVGTDSDCQNGVPVYYAWFEFYPHLSYTINTITVKPGDVISAEVKYGGGSFTVTLTDESNPGTFSTSTKMNNAQRSSAEWIAEAPSGGGIQPLADFGSIGFGADYTSVPLTCDASLTTHSGSIASFPNANVFQITMVNSSGTPEAIPSGLSDSGTSFYVSRTAAGS